GLNLTTATLTLTNGVAVGIYGTKGISLRSGANFVCEGTAINLNRLVRYQVVQEQPVVWGSTATTMGLLDLNGATTLQVNIRFTDVSLLAEASGRRNLATVTADPVNPFAIAHS